ncbi:hypothetical protein CS0771_02500 [Catellatospora sp. IY07-71]|uniref:helix-turn-helix domain-containing protein n=1 Tax=Catellatospora sp. IY07-71 TaxID=2728827 RepID=UPI001BB44939|nr:helix-turn-helix transcriptional regulator [Catellatospora sp. IY07-71]BCJ70706.1 hypothetical protein CS0771_02500 [Catellatospora sp. IY07-71]
MEHAYDTPEVSPAGAGNVEAAGPGWSARVTRTVASQIKHWRERRGLSAKQLSDRTGDLGFRVPRTVIANLETGRRDAVGVAEVLILAAALDVPPTMLLTAVGREEAVEILPDVEVPPWLGRGWILGARHPDYKSFSRANWQDARRAIALYDIHRLLVLEHQQIQTRIKRLTEHDGLSSDQSTLFGDGPQGRTSLLNHAAQEFAYSLDRIRQHRRLIQAEGFLLPTLPPGLAVSVRGSESTGRHHAEDPASDGDSATAGDDLDRLLAPILYDRLNSQMNPPSGGSSD